MIVKGEDANVYKGTLKRKKKGKGIDSTQAVIIIKDDVQSDTEANTVVKKKKKLNREKYSDQVNLSKKTESKSKDRTCCESIVIPESDSESELLQEKKQTFKILKKKKDQYLSSVPAENNQDSVSGIRNKDLPKTHKTNSQQKELAGKKHKRYVPLNSESDSEMMKKKKKKKHKVSSLIPSDNQKGNQSVFNQHLSKNHKSTFQERAFSGEKDRENVVQNPDVSKKKKKNASSLVLASDQDRDGGISVKDFSNGDYRRKQKTSFLENALDKTKDRTDTAQNTEVDSVVTKKKKRKDVSSSELTKNQESYYPRIPSENLPKEDTKSQRKLLHTKDRETLIQNTEDNGVVTKKKKKKIPKEEDGIIDCLTPPDDSRGEMIVYVKSPKKKKKKKSESKPAEDIAVGNGDNRSCKNKWVSKKRKKETSQNFAEQPSVKKKKAKIKQEPPDKEAMEFEDDVKVVGMKKGNCDEVNIDKARRQSLQEEIDRESGKTKAAGYKRESDVKVGQWSTAAFESSEQKTKFLRLMGGFKKEPASAPNPSGAATKPNMALDKRGEKTLQQNLQAEFEKAVGMRHQKGIGLGFQPAPTKRVYIDKHASKSTKFEDYIFLH
uniref:Small acidic protein-like domain-containing protein n=1 Tax=Sphenodon punctatus TaxID=8508 RepID=A0A8D0GL01_SPHPU